MNVSLPQTSKFVGHQAKRSDGKEKRIKLLEATLKIIAKDGIRGVRHRAVASEAGVSLSSTTYYFKDIHDLITDAFIYFSDKELEKNKQLETQSHRALTKFQSGINTNIKKTLSPLISSFILEHIANEIKNIDSRRIEYVLQNEALRNKKLAEIMIKMQNSILDKIEQFYQYLGSKKPLYDAHITIASIRHIEYQLVVNENLSINDPNITEIVDRLIDGLFPVIE